MPSPAWAFRGGRIPCFSTSTSLNGKLSWGLRTRGGQGSPTCWASDPFDPHPSRRGSPHGQGPGSCTATMDSGLIGVFPGLPVTVLRRLPRMSFLRPTHGCAFCSLEGPEARRLRRILASSREMHSFCSISPASAGHGRRRGHCWNVLAAAVRRPSARILAPCGSIRRAGREDPRGNPGRLDWAPFSLAGLHAALDSNRRNVAKKKEEKRGVRCPAQQARLDV